MFIWNNEVKIFQTIVGVYDNGHFFEQFCRPPVGFNAGLYAIWPVKFRIWILESMRYGLFIFINCKNFFLKLFG